MIEPGPRRLQFVDLILEVFDQRRGFGGPLAQDLQPVQPVLVGVIEGRGQVLGPGVRNRHDQRGSEAGALADQRGQRLADQQGRRRVGVVQVGQPAVNLVGHPEPVGHGRSPPGVRAGYMRSRPGEAIGAVGR